jgi:hypothetical protein
MCVIAVCQLGQELTKKKFENCFKSNSHGFGMAWIDTKGLNFSKGLMDEKEAWEVYNEFKKYAHVAHFRITSSGGTCPELTHPFIVSADSPITKKGHGENLKVLFHNGTVSDWKDKVFSLAVHAGKYPKGKMSDTRMAAMAVHCLGEEVLEDFGGKFVVADKSGFNLYGEFEKDDEGIRYSNGSYKDVRTYYGGTCLDDGAEYIPWSERFKGAMGFPIATGKLFKAEEKKIPDSIVDDREETEELLINRRGGVYPKELFPNMYRKAVKTNFKKNN